MRRLNEVVGLFWNLEVKGSSVRPSDQTTQKGKPLYLAEVQVALSVSEADGSTSTRGGVGAALMADPDDALKTAQAEALKKASNQFGMALELWTEEGRDVVAKGRAAASGDVNALKTLVFEKALALGAEPNAESVAKTLGVDPEALQDQKVLSALLEA